MNYQQICDEIRKQLMVRSFTAVDLNRGIVMLGMCNQITVIGSTPPYGITFIMGRLSINLSATTEDESKRCDTIYNPTDLRKFYDIIVEVIKAGDKWRKAIGYLTLMSAEGDVTANDLLTGAFALPINDLGHSVEDLTNAKQIMIYRYLLAPKQRDYGRIHSKAGQHLMINGLFIPYANMPARLAGDVNAIPDFFSIGVFDVPTLQLDPMAAGLFGSLINDLVLVDMVKVNY